MILSCNTTKVSRFRLGFRGPRLEVRLCDCVGCFEGFNSSFCWSFLVVVLPRFCPAVLSWFCRVLYRFFSLVLLLTHPVFALFYNEWVVVLIPGRVDPYNSRLSNFIVVVLSCVLSNMSLCFEETLYGINTYERRLMLYIVFVTMIRTYERWLIMVGNRTTSCESMDGFLAICQDVRKALGWYQFITLHQLRFSRRESSLIAILP